MRVARVYTNETCNQNCAFCNTRKPTDRRAFVNAAAVHERIDAAETKAIVLTGGEPTMRRDLAKLIAHARTAGAEDVILETNAALLDDASARALADAGLSTARAHLPVWGDELDQITRDPGGFARTRTGLSALARAGVRLVATAPVVRDNQESLASLPAALADSGLPFEELRLNVPTEAPDQSALLTVREAASVVSATEAACRRVDLGCALEADGLIPPCLFDRPARVAHLFTLTAGGANRTGYRKLAACEPCSVADRCPGAPEAALARESDLAVTPIREDRVRRRLSVISSVEGQIARELTQEDVYQREGGSALPARIVRINFRCNQACHFCFVSTHLRPADDDAIRSAIVDIARRGGVLMLSGGEPTLNPKLVNYVKLGRAEGAAVIELQTNAILLEDAALVDSLVRAGVDEFFVSLHGSEASISDAITDARGTFEKTVRALDVLAARAVSMRVNFVFCGTNLSDFPAYVDFVANRWPKATIVVSFVAPSTDMVPRSRALIPRYTDIMPSLTEGLTRAEAHGVNVTGFESMCGIPLCLVPAELARFAAIEEIPEGFDRGEFVVTAACQRCTLRGRCFGLRRGYAELYGDEELAAVR